MIDPALRGTADIVLAFELKARDAPDPRQPHVRHGAVSQQPVSGPEHGLADWSSFWFRGHPAYSGNPPPSAPSRAP